MAQHRMRLEIPTCVWCDYSRSCGKQQLIARAASQRSPAPTGAAELPRMTPQTCIKAVSLADVEGGAPILQPQVHLATAGTAQRSTNQPKTKSNMTVCNACLDRQLPHTTIANQPSKCLACMTVSSFGVKISCCSAVHKNTFLPAD
jgi:hypothetical protein